MKVCIITCQNADNYGARLQNYALSHYLQKLGLDVEVINYQPDYMEFHTKILYWPGFSLRQWVKLILQLHLRIRAVFRHKIFCRFSLEHIPLSKRIYKSVYELRKSPPDADMYIAGSDQIWNTLFCNGIDSAYYLKFGDDRVKRISYAASFATPDLREGTIEFVKQGLGNFDSISVREASGLRILSTLSLYGRLVVDPVFLLSTEEWDALASSEKEDDYILIYDFMGSSVIQDIARRLSKLFNCKIYSIGSQRYLYADKNFIYARPEQFVELIKNARYVVSNSYHGTVFSLVYHCNFFVVKREDGLNERMKEFLTRYNLMPRLIEKRVSDEVLKANVDFGNVDAIIKKDIIKSKNFLKEQVKDCIGNPILRN